MSQVRNLRAMFENKGETSPPDRGRSPGPILSRTTSAESPRPLSKVRTNFIAIEKDGRIGLQRDPSDDSVTSRRKFSDGSAGEMQAPAVLERTNSFTDKLARANVTQGPIPESARYPTDATPAAPAPAANTARKRWGQAPPENPDKQTGVEEPGAKPQPADPAVKRVVAKKNGVNNGVGETLNGLRGQKEKEKAETVKSTTRENVKPVSVSTTAKATKSPAKSPTASKTPTKPTGRPAEKKPAPVEKTTAPRPATAAGSHKKPPAIQVSPSSGTGFAKPKPKSPTKPVQLPPSLMTHTAASGSKVQGPRQSLSRASGEIRTVHSLGRSLSRASGSAAATTTANSKATVQKELKRQRSTIGSRQSHNRPSLGPPPKEQPSPRDHKPNAGAVRKDKDVDEGFLARMMRPTQSSAQKTHDRTPTTPPKKTATPVAPAAATAVAVPKRTAVPVREAPSKEVPHTVQHKKTVPPTKVAELPTVKKASAVQKAAAATAKEEQKSAAQEIAPAVEKTASAEEAIEVAKEAEGSVALPTEPSEDETAKEIAPAVEQTASAGEAIEAAKQADGNVHLPDDEPSEPVEVVLATADEPAADIHEEEAQVAAAEPQPLAEVAEEGETQPGHQHESEFVVAVEPEVVPEAVEPVEETEVPSEKEDHAEPEPNPEPAVEAEVEAEPEPEPEVEEKHGPENEPEQPEEVTQEAEDALEPAAVAGSEVSEVHDIAEETSPAVTDEHQGEEAEVEAEVTAAPAAEDDEAKHEDEVATAEGDDQADRE